MLYKLYQIEPIKGRTIQLLIILFKKKTSPQWKVFTHKALHWKCKIKPLLEDWKIKMSKRTYIANNKGNDNTQTIASEVTEDLSQDEGAANQ